MMERLLSIVLLVSTFCASSAFHAAVADNEVKPPYYCIIFEGNVTGSIDYETHDNKTASFPFVLDESTLNVSGSCLHAVEHNRSVEALRVEFLPKDVPATTGQWALTVQFENDAQNTFRVANVALLAYLPDSLNSTDQTVKYVLDKADDPWAVTEKDGYTCSKSAFGLRQSTSGPLHAQVELAQVKALAFARLPTADFPPAQVFEQCLFDTKTSDLVPIVVGACLAGLVVIVLVAYLIGRARARRQGYASV